MIKNTSTEGCPMRERFAKIVATIGPTSRSEKTLTRLIQAGVDVTRLNFSHGTHADHGENIATIRKVSAALRKPVAILQDLQGPKLRVGRLPEDGLALTADEILILTPEETFEEQQAAHPDAIIVPMDVPNLMDSVRPGNRILLDDGHMELEVVEVSAGRLMTRVLLGGTLKSHKGVNLPGAFLNIPPLTDKDKEDLIFGLEQHVDVVAISFVRAAEDIHMVREFIRQHAPDQTHIPIIAKLERPEAIENLDAIMEAADGVMVARGDLAVETSAAVVPIIQKRIIQSANQHARIVITATQMLESMIHNPRPTRAEASDVANAIFDGTDAVMLSGETASGDYPVEAVIMMDRIIREAETHFAEWGQCHPETYEYSPDDAISLTRAARELAHDRDVSSIAVFTQTGRTALLMSKARPRVTVIAFTPEQETLNRMALYWGVRPILVPFVTTVENMLAHVDNALLSSTGLEIGNQVVMISGFPIGAKRQPNFALLHTIGDRI